MTQWQGCSCTGNGAVMVVQEALVGLAGTQQWGRGGLDPLPEANGFTSLCAWAALVCSKPCVRATILSLSMSETTEENLDRSSPTTRKG